MFSEVEPVLSWQEDLFLLTDIGNLGMIDIMTFLMGSCDVGIIQGRLSNISHKLKVIESDQEE